MQPVFTMAMHGVVACCTQTGNRERRVSMTVYLVCLLSLVFLILCVQERLCELVKLMGGQVSADFTRHVSLADTCEFPVVYCLHTSVHY